MTSISVFPAPEHFILQSSVQMHRLAMHIHVGAQACSAGTYPRTRARASFWVRLAEHAWRVARAPVLAELSAPAA